MPFSRQASRSHPKYWNARATGAEARIDDRAAGPDCPVELLPLAVLSSPAIEIPASLSPGTSLPIEREMAGRKRAQNAIEEKARERKGNPA